MRTPGALRPVEVWRYRGLAHAASEEASRWLSHFLQRAVTLVACPDDMDRVANPDWAPRPTPLGFADGYPILLLSEASLADLNARLREPVDMMRFRPNLVLRGCPAFEEDRWKTIRIGALMIDILKPCDRCSMVTVDPATAEFAREPLATLATFRRSPTGVLFGQNCASRTPGLIEVGAEVEVIEERAPDELPPNFRLTSER